MNIVVFLAGLFISYVAFALFPPLGIVIPLLLVGYLLKKSTWKAALVAILLSPPLFIPVIFFSCGIVSYLMGNARIREAGLVKDEFFNLDQEFRCYHTSSGCFTNGSELFTHLPNNIAIIMMYKISGEMKGAYHGVYPDRKVVFKLLRKAKAIQVENGNFEKLTIPEFFDVAVKNPEKFKLVSEQQPLKYLTHKNECLIIGNELYAELYNINKKKCFAVYNNHNPDVLYIQECYENNHKKEGE